VKQAITVVIQAGGMSARMGEDKALKPFLGRLLIQRVIDRVTPIADELIVTTNRPAEYEFLNLRLVPDLKPGRGALGGLYTAIASAASPLVAVVACDMPFASQMFSKARSNSWSRKKRMLSSQKQTKATNLFTHCIAVRLVCPQLYLLFPRINGRLSRGFRK
jgi:molybdopterin-guanine dinucleotide biosynthesis protein A